MRVAAECRNIGTRSTNTARIDWFHTSRTEQSSRRDKEEVLLGHGQGRADFVEARTRGHDALGSRMAFLVKFAILHASPPRGTRGGREHGFVEPVDKRDDFKVTSVSARSRVSRSISNHVATKISSSFDDRRGKFSVRVTARVASKQIFT